MPKVTVTKQAQLQTDQARDTAAIAKIGKSGKYDKLTDAELEKLHAEYKIKFDQAARLIASDAAQGSDVTGTTPMGIAPASAPTGDFLTPDERIYLNQLHSRVTQKYTTAVTDSMDLLQVPMPLTMDEARKSAITELEAAIEQRITEANDTAERATMRQRERLAKVQARHRTRLARLANEASRRGLGHSTIIINNFEAVHAERDQAEHAINVEIEFIETRRINTIERLRHTLNQRTEALAKRIHAQSMQQNLRVIQERGRQQSRSLRDLMSVKRTDYGLPNPINYTNLINDELFSLYLHWLSGQPVHRAARVVSRDPLFFFNLPSRLFFDLMDICEQRALFHP